MNSGFNMFNQTVFYLTKGLQIQIYSIITKRVYKKFI